ncbi:MAG TPA: 16S rRNA (cytosine(1402)-N(4))-methyltransferase RsmH [Candidatus Paceibacterota bacterium]|nr:16S rRNA (cytosine(1402)-N(4))-methyltransferase RsmH [Candidatus Paceibacterota bacterium]
MMTHSLTPVREQQRLRREEDGGAREQKLGNHIRGGERQRAHVSVLVPEVLDMLSLKPGELVVDATAGRGGHAEAMLKAASVRVVALDADPESVEASRERLSRFGERAAVLEANFRDIETVLNRAGASRIDKALFDLGWNSTQLASGRGFSFMHDEPLDMSYGARPASGFTAAEIVNSWEEHVLADVFFGYGEERYARPIARAIVERRADMPIESTDELVEIIRSAVPSRARHGRINPATKTFQALRIAVNDELGSLEKGIRGAWNLLAPGGRIAVITFHSIEDRAVKNLLRELAADDAGRLLVKKPVVASKEELTNNPSARSAKLRGIEKLA